MADPARNEVSRGGNAPQAGAPSGAPSGGRAQLHGRVAVLKHVITPFIQALAEVRNANKGAPPPSAEEEAQMLSSLVEGAMHLAQATLAALKEDAANVTDDVRWMVVAAATHNVAARFRATGQIMAAEEAAALATAAFDHEKRFQSQSVAPGESIPNAVGTFRAKMLEALVPVVNAVAQYSFGRAEHMLLAQVSERLLKTADQVTRGLAPAGCGPRDWRLLCWSVLQAAGYLYSDCHFAEADRLLYMEKDERDAYFREHEQMPPLTFVWQAFDQRMGMLATLITYLDIPETARLDEQVMDN